MKEQIDEIESVIDDIDGTLLANGSQLFYCETCKNFLDGFDVTKKEFKGLRIFGWNIDDYSHTTKANIDHPIIKIKSAEQLREFLNLKFIF